MAWNKLSTYKTRILDFGDGAFAVQYHDTMIVKVYREQGRRIVELNTGGERGDWSTQSRAIGSVTTKKKMNQASHQFSLGYHIYQQDHCWYVCTANGTFKWDDGNTFVIDAYTGLPYASVEPFMHKEKAA